jgi:hypothetical protein
MCVWGGEGWPGRGLTLARHGYPHLVLNKTKLEIEANLFKLIKF